MFEYSEQNMQPGGGSIRVPSPATGITTFIKILEKETPQIKRSFIGLREKLRNKRNDFFVLNVVVLTIMIFLQPD